MVLSFILQIQDTAVSTLTTPAVEPQEKLRIFELLAKGGPVMIPIAILLVITIYVWIYKFITINAQSKIDNRLIPQVKDQLVLGNLKSAKGYVANVNTSVARVVDTGLDMVGSPMNEVESGLETASNIEIL